MAHHPHPRQRLAAIAVCVVLGVGWYQWLRPTTLGGDQTYIVVQGTSMEPTYHDGDLVLVRKEAHYAKGDIVAFRAGGEFDDQTRVIHRIVGHADNDAFTTQGDNRDRLDPWQPRPNNILGRAFLHVPRLGGLAVEAGQPQVLAALGGGAVFLGRRQRRRKRMRRLIGGATPTPVPEPRVQTDASLRATLPARWQRHTEPRWAFTGFVISVPLALLVLLVGWSSIQAADTAIKSQPVGQLDYGIDLDYRFKTDPSPVYPTGTIGTKRAADGTFVPTDALYAKLLRRLEVVFNFEATASGTTGLRGTYMAEAWVTMPEGWSTRIAAIEPTPVNGSAIEVLSIDFDDAAAQVAQVAQLTGVGGGSYTLAISPRLEVDGSAGGVPVHEISAPEQTFTVTNGIVKALPVQDTTTTKRLTHDVRQRARYQIGLLSMDIQAARAMVGGLALVLLAAVSWFASVLFGGVGLRESDRIAARYRSQMVDVTAATAPPGPVVMVGAIEELARVARVEQSVILHEDLGDGGHRYRVFLGTVTYEYETAPEHGGSAAMTDAAEAADVTPDEPGA